MLFVIEEEIFRRFPELLVGTVQVSGLDNSGRFEEIAVESRVLENETRRNFESETLGEHPRIAAWRKAYSSFGAKPKKYRSSVENLVRLILRKGGLPSINPVVDLINFVSVKHVLPVGGDDLDKLEGPLRLCFASGDESFLPLNSEEREAVKPGEVIYRDDSEVLCRRWNWRESDKTKMTQTTKRILLVAEALPPVSGPELKEALADLERLILKFCGGESKTAVLHRQSNRLE